MLTRVTAVTRIFTLQPWYNLKSSDDFLASPIKKDILQRLLMKKTGMARKHPKLSQTRSSVR